MCSFKMCGMDGMAVEDNYVDYGQCAACRVTKEASRYTIPEDEILEDESTMDSARRVG